MRFTAEMSAEEVSAEIDRGLRIIPSTAQTFTFPISDKVAKAQLYPILLGLWQRRCEARVIFGGLKVEVQCILPIRYMEAVK